MVVADMIEMGMTGYCDQRRRTQPRKLSRKAHDPQSGIKQQALFTALYKPDVAAIKDVDVWFKDMSNSIAASDAAVPIPRIRHLRQAHRAADERRARARMGATGRSDIGTPRAPAGPNTALGSGNAHSRAG